MGIFILIVIVAYAIYWVNTIDERENNKFKRQRQLEEIQKRNQKYRADKLEALEKKFGKKYSLLGLIIVSKSSYYPHNHNSVVKYSWKKILVEDVYDYPKIKGKIIEISKKLDHRNEVGKSFTFDLSYDKDDSYITTEEFQEDITKENKMLRVPQVKRELRQLNSLRDIHVREQILWQQYYRGLPSDFRDEMTGLDFERYIENLLIKKGYKVFRTKSSGDQGVDIVAEDPQRKKIAIQTKKYSGKVSNSAVQEVVAGRHYYQCTEAWVITNSVFTDSSIQLARVNKVRLIDGAELIQFFRGVETQIHTVPTFDKNRFNQIRPIAERIFDASLASQEFINSPYDYQIQKLEIELTQLKRSLGLSE